MMNLRKEIRKVIKEAEEGAFSAHKDVIEVKGVRTHKKHRKDDDAWFGFVDIITFISGEKIFCTLYWDEATHPESIQLVKLNGSKKWSDKMEEEILSLVDRNFEKIEKHISWHLESSW